jgi:teichuronic acid biosynthesis glycosyltransferase TuaH
VKITFLSHTAMGGAYVVGSHHLARALARAGHDVTHVSAGVSMGHLALAVKDRFVRARIRRWLRGGEDFDGVKDVVPFTLLPWPMARRSAALMKGYSRLMLASPLRGLGARVLRDSDCLMVDDPRFVGVALASGANVIYRATDLYAVMRNDPTIVAAERLMCRRARQLVATSKPVAEHLEAISGKRVRVMTNGVDYEHFAGDLTSASDASHLPGQRADRAVYVGAFDSRFGREAFRGAAIAWPQKTFLLIGAGAERVSAEVARPNVMALGPVPYEKLPAILRACAVGLLPLSSDASNEGRSPMKLYEYAAAGLAIAATSTDELRRRTLPTLFLGRTAAEFVAAVGQAFDCAGNAALLDASRTLAFGESWAGKARELLDLATGAQPDAAPARNTRVIADAAPRAVAGSAR